MPMSMNQVNSILQGLSDPQLQMEMKSPQAGVPQYMVLAEMQRRQKMRAEATQPAPPNPPTVAQDIMSQGVAGLPQMASGQDAPGGVASFAGGGAVGFPNSTYPSGGPEYSMDFENSPLMDYWRRVKQQWANSFAMPEPNKTVGQAVSDAASNVYGKIKGTDAYKNVAKGLQDIDAEVARSQASIPDLTQYKFAMPSLSTGSTAAAAPAQEQRTFDAAKLPPVAMPPDMQEEPAASSAARSGIAALAKAKGVDVAVPPSSSDTQRPPLTPPPNVPALQIDSPDKYLEMVSANSPDSTPEMMARYDKRDSRIAGDRKNAVNMAMIQAGLGMMAAGAKSPNFLGSIGEGGIAGLKSYTDEMNRLNAESDKTDAQRDALLLARDAAKRGNFKTAAEIANAANARNVALHGQDVQERRYDMQMMQADRQFQTQMDKVDKQIAAQIAMENARNATMLKGYSMRAAASGGVGGLRPKDYATLVQRERDALLKSDPVRAMTDPSFVQQAEAMAHATVRARLGMEPMPQQQAAPARRLTSKGFVE